MEDMISFSTLPTNLESFSQQDVLQKNQSTTKTFALFWPKKNCRSEVSENATIEQTGLSEWNTFNFIPTNGINEIDLLQNLKDKIPIICSPPLCIDLLSFEEQDKDSDGIANSRNKEENYFSPSDEVLFDHNEDLLLFDEPITNNDICNPTNPDSSESHNDQPHKSPAQSQEVNNIDQSASTYQSPLVLDTFKPSITPLEPHTPPSLNVFSFHQLLSPSSTGKSNQDTNDGSKMEMKLLSQLPPISDFQVSMKLNEEVDNSASLVDDGNPAKHLFNEDLFEPLNSSELEISHNTWSLENLLNLSFPVPNSSDETLTTNRNKFSTSQSYYSDLYQTLLAQGSGSHMSLSHDICINSSFPASSFLHSDPQIQLRDEDKHNGDLTNYVAWNQMGRFIEGSNDNVGWLGNYVTTLEEEQKGENFDIEDLNYGSDRKCRKNVSPSFTSMINVKHKVPKQLDKRFNLNLNANDGLVHRCDGSKSIFSEHLDQKHEKIDLGVPRKTKKSICLWQFLKELLLYPETYQNWIRWVDKNKGVFKIEDSVNVARMWGQRKNKPAMNYDKLSRSIRQYYKKGIIKKTTSSKRLVYQFCPQYL